VRALQGPSSSLDAVYSPLGRLAGVLIYVVAGVIAVDVFSRSFGLSLRWPFEVYPWAAYWAALIGAGYVTHLDGNVKMDLLVEEHWLGPFERLQPLFTGLVSLAYVTTMTWAGALLTMNLVKSGRVTYELRTPLAYHALAIPIGFGLAAVAILAGILSRRSKKASA
jgi:TRAP-type C4-dicarboxylate transport system permease small subunit